MITKINELKKILEHIHARVKTERYVYHAANINNREMILSDGIKQHRGDQWMLDTDIEGPAVFATNSSNPDDWFDSTFDDDVWQIDTAAISYYDWYADPNYDWDKKYKHVYTQNDIPPDAITLFRKGTGRDKLFDSLDVFKTPDMETISETLNDIVNEAGTETMTFWHGGNLDDMGDVAHKSGRWEHGPGLYLTTQYDVVQKYAKGSRKLYKVTVEKGTNLGDTMIPVGGILDFVNQFVIKSKIKLVVASINRLAKDDKLNAQTFLNIIINEEAIKNTNTSDLKKFFLRNKIDYSLEYNAFGWGETMMILFNNDKIVSVDRVKSTDRFDTYNFPTDFTTTNESFDKKDYLKWKRENVSYRGMQDRYAGDDGNGGMAVLGQGLYTAALSNKSMAKKYGTVYYVVNGRPKNPKVFNTINDWETWFGNTLVWDYCKANGIKNLDKRYFYENTSIVGEMEKLGYDGVEIRGREYVNYKPSDDILYFENDYQLEDYYDRNFGNDTEHYFKRKYGNDIK